MGGHVRFFMSSSPAFTARAVSCRGMGQCFAWQRGTRDCVAEKEYLGGCMCWGKLRQEPQGRAAGNLGERKKKKKIKTEEGGAGRSKTQGQAITHHAVVALLSQCSLEELFGYCALCFSPLCEMQM